MLRFECSDLQIFLKVLRFKCSDFSRNSKKCSDKVLRWCSDRAEQKKHCASTAPKVLELQLPPHPSRNPSILCCPYVPYYFGFQVPNFNPLYPLLLLLFGFTRYPQFPHRVPLLRQPSLSKTFRLTAASTKIPPLATFLPHFFLKNPKTALSNPKLTRLS